MTPQAVSLKHIEITIYLTRYRRQRLEIVFLILYKIFRYFHDWLKWSRSISLRNGGRLSLYNNIQRQNSIHNSITSIYKHIFKTNSFTSITSEFIIVVNIYKWKKSLMTIKKTMFVIYKILKIRINIQTANIIYILCLILLLKKG